MEKINRLIKNITFTWKDYLKIIVFSFVFALGLSLLTGVSFRIIARYMLLAIITMLPTYHVLVLVFTALIIRKREKSE